MAAVGFAEATQLFDLYCRSKGLAERTLETYRDALRGLGVFLEATGRTQEIPTIGDLRAYIARMLERGLSPLGHSESFRHAEAVAIN
jgi:site-specific recombinase XerD